jgi:FlaG/FlaF family flagellin (archaellin)
MIKTKKGASEVIVVIMIVMVSVILATLFFAWLKESSKSKLDQTADEMKQASDFSCMDASFIIESCNVNDDGNISVVLSNNSDLRLFNLILSINGKNNSAEDTSIVGRFETVINPGEIKNLSTASSFTFITGDQTTLSDLNASTITNAILTNGNCPKKIINLSCDIE